MDGTANVKISNLIVALMSDHTGRGPTRVRTYIADDVITTVLRDTLTKGEQTLVQSGQHDLVLANRRAFSELMRDRLVEGVEDISGRKVVALLSDHSLDPDIAVKTLVLERLPD